MKTTEKWVMQMEQIINVQNSYCWYDDKIYTIQNNVQLSRLYKK